MWSSQVTVKGSDSSEALRQIARGVREFKDATVMRDEERRWCKYLPRDIRPFRPHLWSWLLLIGVFSAGGAVIGVLEPEANFSRWSELAVTVAVSVFVLGVSITTVARSLSESGRFAAEYLFDVCNIRDFWGVTFSGVIFAIIASVGADLDWLPMSLRGGLGAGALGGAIGCVCMLAFVMWETVRCSVPTGSIHASAEYAARKLCHAFLRSAYLGVFNAAHKKTIEEWCLDNAEAVRPPSEYWKHLLLGRSQNSGEDVKEQEVVLDFEFDIHKGYMDFELDGLKKIDQFLRVKSSKFYLAPHGVASDKAIVGRLHSSEEQFGAVHSEIVRQTTKCCRFKWDRFDEVNKVFWKGHFLKLEAALGKAIENADREQFDMYLKSAWRPLGVLREIWRYEIVRQTSIETSIKCYEILDLFVRALKRISQATAHPDASDEVAAEFIGILKERISDEVQKAISDGDCQTVKLFTEVIPRMYKVIGAPGPAKDSWLWNERARFGQFYAFIEGLFDDAGLDAEVEKQMKKILHDGITAWLIVALDRGDVELVGPLCSSARDAVFGRKELKFQNSELMSQHFVLTGWLLSKLLDGKGVKAEDVSQLFFDKHPGKTSLDFNEIAKFHVESRFPYDSVCEYMRILYPLPIRTVNQLTGIRHGSGSGSTGAYETSLAFVFLSGFSGQQFAKKEVKVCPVDLMGPNMTNAIEQLKDNANLGKVYKHRYLGMIDHLESWLEDCKKAFEMQRERKIAEADLDSERRSRFVKEFWIGYKEAVPFLSYCVRNGQLRVDGEAGQPVRYQIDKSIFVKDQPDMMAGLGKDEGRWVARASERDLLCELCGLGEVSSATASVEDEEFEVEVDEERRQEIENRVREAQEWLAGRGCKIYNGVIILIGGVHPEAVFDSDERFVPPWREDNAAFGFSGFYGGFPLVWLQKKLASVCCVACDLHTWKGVRIREALLQEEVYGEITIMPVTDEDINKAIHEGKLTEDQRNRARGLCWVQGDLFWDFKGQELPRRQFFGSTEGGIPGVPNNRTPDNGDVNVRKEVV